MHSHSLTARFISLLLCFLALALTSSTSDAQTFRWFNNNALFYIGDLLGANGQWQDEFEEAADRWNDSPSAFWINTSRSSGTGFCTNSGNNSVQWSVTFCGDQWGSNTLAITQYVFTANFLQKADIVFNDNLTWSVYDGNYQSPTHDFRRVAVHELGHAMGLAHLSNSSALMAPFVSNTYLPTLDDSNDLLTRYSASYHTLTLTNAGNGYIQVRPLVNGTGVVNTQTNTFVTSNYDFMDCHEETCTLSVQDGLRLTLTAIADDEFVSWTGSTITANSLELSPMVNNRSYTANYSTGNGVDPVPETPTSVRTAVANALVSLRWNAATYSTSYEIYRCESSAGTDCAEPVASVSSTAYSDAFATYGKLYYYRVAACNSSGCSEPSALVSGNRGFSTPAAPAVSASASYVVIAWFDQATVESFEVFRCRRSDESSCGSPIGSTDGGFIIDRDGSPGVVYYYRIRHCFEGECGNLSNFVEGIKTASVLAPASPAAPQTSASKTGVSLSWTTVALAESYQVFRCTSDEESSCSSLLTNTASSTYDDITAEPGVEYYYRLKACISDVCSDLGEAATGIRDLPDPIPEIPLLNAAESSTDDVSLSWSAVAGATSYNLHTCADEDVASCDSNGSNTTELMLTLSDGESGIEYYFRLKACNETGCSDFSDFVVGGRLSITYATYGDGLLTLPAIAVESDEGTQYFSGALKLTSATPSYEFVITGLTPLLASQPEEFAFIVRDENRLVIPRAEVNGTFYYLEMLISVVAGIETLRLVSAEEIQN